jgi:nitroimidazol reductase NimA-like FMN-containing flavoprotein (pyridoxamine 5'-phosphate oxidase superfamily)
MIEKLTEQEIEELLKDNIWGHLGCNDGLNTYVYPLNYLYDGEYITCHSQEGFKVQVMRKYNRVCFQVDEIKSEKRWKSVIVVGQFQEIHDEQEDNNARKAFADRRLFLKKSESAVTPRADEKDTNIQDKNRSKPVIYRILINEKTGVFEND